MNEQPAPMNSDADDNGIQPHDMAGLLWSLAVAAALGSLLVLLASQWSSSPAQGAPAAMRATATPVFVELREGAADGQIFRLPHGASLADLFNAAHRPIPRNVDLRRACTSGDLLTVRPDGTLALDRMDGSRLLALGLKIPLNDAGVADLVALPGIGESLALRIVDARLAAGAFRNWEDVERIRGIGTELKNTLKAYTTL